ncbi:UNVERIFIED_CONTAM: hypothetical protein Sradi_3583400 [Sesamum radiatum]|uniref:Uncharacterized protein n=1 Tax=Sesamum radiatum TaxID=300843 RepID=A0AAW2QGK7_SESRA
MCSSKLDGGLGFRNLEAFNLVLLAKQLWRLLTGPGCLVSKVLKAKYFPRHHLFEAQVGVRPSFTWRSIIAARDLLRSSCRWRISLGHLVDVWKDPLIPRRLFASLLRILIVSRIYGLMISFWIPHKNGMWSSLTHCYPQRIVSVEFLAATKNYERSSGFSGLFFNGSSRLFKDLFVLAINSASQERSNGRGGSSCDERGNQITSASNIGNRFFGKEMSFRRLCDVT